MRQIKFIFPLVALLLTMTSCSDDNYSLDSVRTDKIVFTLTSDAPVAEYPTEQIGYTFRIAYPKGIVKVVATLDGEEIDGSVCEYGDAPVEADYNFRYTLLASQAGQTVDFVFTATGADGYSQSTDYPVYVYAKQPDIKIAIPEDAPSESDVADELSFVVKISSENDLMKIRTLKNNIPIDGLTKTAGFTEPNADDYVFTYMPAAADTGQTVNFSFEVTDAEGNLVAADYAVKFVRPASDEIDEYYGINLGFHRCTSYGPFLSTADGAVYTVAEGNEKCADIDIVAFWSANSTTIGMAVCAANTGNASTIYNAATMTALGGESDDIITQWPVRNATMFKKTTLSADEYTAVFTLAELRSAYDDCTADESGLANMLKAGNVVAFKTVGGHYGLLKVVSPGTGNTSYAVIDYKTEKR